MFLRTSHYTSLDGSEKQKIKTIYHRQHVCVMVAIVILSQVMFTLWQLLCENESKSVPRLCFHR